MTQRAAELLYDSEATLRLVGRELDALGDLAPTPDAAGAAAPVPAPASAAPEPESLSFILRRTSQELTAALRALRDCRAALQQAAVDQLHATHGRLRDVSSATEAAATHILDGLDRAQSLVDELDGVEGAADAPARRAELRAALRAELWGVMECVQFQDLTAQQLDVAASALASVERRLAELAAVVDPRHAPAAEDAALSTAAPDADYGDATERQARVEEVLRARRG